MADFNPIVADIYHGEVILPNGFKLAKDSGLQGIIHKATQGSNYSDKAYSERRTAAEGVGLLWGAYHFNDGSNVKGQVDWFMKNANPGDQTLMALDYEDNPKSNMSVAQMVDFLHTIEEKLGRKAVIYSGNKLKENIAKLDKDDFAYVTSHRLWLAQYGSKPTLPKGFKSYWLHQYTGDGVGPAPHWVTGIKCPGNNGIDLNVFGGTDLAKEWA